ncbi:MAG: ABC transporter ATP-binding protein [Spirochaetaceae bacterium]|nr:MAG: ABC transporter ATP-binding protein [Spirochaetaceae bacterium]
MLEISGVHVYRQGSHILKGVDLSLSGGSLALIGRNGMGKTTLISTIMGLLRSSEGSIRFMGQELIGKKPCLIARKGIGLVPQGKRVFRSLTVDEHLKLAFEPKRKHQADIYWNVERVYELFPRLKERIRQEGTRLSGGEQQMLAIGRALVTNPSLLLMDEPSEGLSPIMMETVIEACHRLTAAGISLLVVEQSLHFASSVSDRYAILMTGAIVQQGEFPDLLRDRQLLSAYMGISNTRVAR